MVRILTQQNPKSRLNRKSPEICMAFKQPKKFADSLKSFLDKYPHRRQLKRGMILSLWPEIVGSAIAAQCENLRFEGSKLVVNVRNAGWRQELHLQRYTIQKKLNEEVSEEIISEIIVKG